MAMNGNATNARRQRAFETLRKVLAEIDWSSDPDEATSSFHVDFGPPHVPVSDAVAAISLENEQFLFYIHIGLPADSSRRDEVARFTTLANSGLCIGNFEMEYDDGIVRFKSSVDFSNTELSEPLIRNAILGAMNAIEVYAEPLIDVIGRGKGAAAAFREARAKLARSVS